MKVYTLTVDPNDYDNAPYLYGVYDSQKKAEQAIQENAIEEGEPALLLTHEYDTWECAECWHYPEYEHSRYYIGEWEVK